MHREEREGGRCAEVCADWHSGAAVNWREKCKKEGAIEGEKEGAHYGMQEHSKTAETHADYRWRRWEVRWEAQEGGRCTEVGAN